MTSVVAAVNLPKLESRTERKKIIPKFLEELMKTADVHEKLHLLRATDGITKTKLHKNLWNDRIRGTIGNRTFSQAEQFSIVLALMKPEDMAEDSKFLTTFAEFDNSKEKVGLIRNKILLALQSDTDKKLDHKYYMDFYHSLEEKIFFSSGHFENIKISYDDRTLELETKKSRMGTDYSIMEFEVPQSVIGAERYIEKLSSSGEVFSPDTPDFFNSNQLSSSARRSSSVSGLSVQIPEKLELPMSLSPIQIDIFPFSPVSFEIMVEESFKAPLGAVSDIDGSEGGSTSSDSQMDPNSPFLPSRRGSFVNSLELTHENTDGTLKSSPARMALGRVVILGMAQDVKAKNQALITKFFESNCFSAFVRFINSCEDVVSEDFRADTKNKVEVIYSIAINGCNHYFLGYKNKFYALKLDSGSVDQQHKNLGSKWLDADNIPVDLLKILNPKEAEIYAKNVWYMKEDQSQMFFHSFIAGLYEKEKSLVDKTEHTRKSFVPTININVTTPHSSALPQSVSILAGTVKGLVKDGKLIF
ncbi:MAG: hypothetical protein V4591_08970 [Bdellovibrionota bacterium]